MGGGENQDGSHDKECIDAICRALEMGYTHIDTAEMYGGGHTEALVGKAIESFDRRELFITSKVWSARMSCRGIETAFILYDDHGDSTVCLTAYLVSYQRPDLQGYCRQDSSNVL